MSKNIIKKQKCHGVLEEIARTNKSTSTASSKPSSKPSHHHKSHKSVSNASTANTEDSRSTSSSSSSQSSNISCTPTEQSIEPQPSCCLFEKKLVLVDQNSNPIRDPVTDKCVEAMLTLQKDCDSVTWALQGFDISVATAGTYLYFAANICNLDAPFLDCLCHAGRCFPNVPQFSSTGVPIPPGRPQAQSSADFVVPYGYAVDTPYLNNSVTPPVVAYVPGPNTAYYWDPEAILHFPGCPSDLNVATDANGNILTTSQFVRLISLINKATLQGAVYGVFNSAVNPGTVTSYSLGDQDPFNAFANRTTPIYGAFIPAVPTAGTLDINSTVRFNTLSGSWIAAVPQGAKRAKCCSGKPNGCGCNGVVIESSNVPLQADPRQQRPHVKSADAPRVGALSRRK